MAAPMNTSKKDKLNEKIRQACESYGDNFTLKPLQEQAIITVCEGKDCIVNLPTGYGKSAIFHLLPKIIGKSVLVISPLNVIQMDQMNNLKEKGISCCRLDQVTDLMSYDENHVLVSTHELNDVIKGKFSIVEVHPEALFASQKGLDLLQNVAFQNSIGAIIIDECHKVEEWQKEFRTAFRGIKTIRAYIDVPKVALSGTITVETMKLLPKVIGLKNAVTIQENPDRPNIFLSVNIKEKSNPTDMYEVIYTQEINKLELEGEKYPVTLLYLPMEHMAHAESMCEQVFGVQDIYSSRHALYYSNNDPMVTEEIIKQLKMPNPRIRLIFCTSAIGMGFDSPLISRIIHGRPPRNISDYWQQIGRAGRSGLAASALLYYNRHDIRKNLPNIKEDIINYCLSVTCLRDNILSAFGFTKRVIANCVCCSLCKDTCSGCNICEHQE